MVGYENQEDLIVLEKPVLVTLLRMAADTSGQHLAVDERTFLQHLMADCKIDADDEGVSL
jgi:hypothetical protein